MSAMRCGGPGGSPPRVRSRRVSLPNTATVIGITSACAEQTPDVRVPRQAFGDHLRVCGADLARRCASYYGYGSPPRVRSRRIHGRTQRLARGITSACAEQTNPVAFRANGGRDHLRVCGADLDSARICLTIRGSPPRVRSRLVRPPFRGDDLGITSACAEQTPGLPERSTTCWDHLRVCGADQIPQSVTQSPGGSPPRVRSRLG